MNQLELFDKFYNCYYQVVRKILMESASAPVSAKRMQEICGELAFEESFLSILPKLKDGPWSALLHNEGSAGYRLALPDSGSFLYPMTDLQKSWLKALLYDERISLFFTDEELSSISKSLGDIPPLYRTEDFLYFDRYRDGDPYKEETYRAVFHTVLAALRERKVLLILYGGKTKESTALEAAPFRLQYSSKDDKFRLLCFKRTKRGFTIPYTLNLSRILDCHLSPKHLPEDFHPDISSFRPVKNEPAQIEIDGRRNSLERVMLHFANYEKHTEYDEERGIYLCSIYYDQNDETELLIELLSFGPVIRILGPESLLGQVQKRISRQHHLLYDSI